MSKLLFISFLAAISFKIAHGQLTPSCNANITECQKISANVSTSNAPDADKCSKYNQTFSCLKNLSCLPESYLRKLFVMARPQLTNVSCEIENNTFPSPDTGCPTKNRACMFKYVDNILKQTETSNSTEAFCLHIANYTQCLNGTGCVNNSLLPSVVSTEQGLNGINTANSCIIPTLRTSYSYLECSSAIEQCRTIEYFPPNDSDVCTNLLNTASCIVSLNCATDVFLRVIQTIYNTNYNNYTKCLNVLNSIFPLEKSGLKDCQQTSKNCTYPYVANIFNSSSADVICREHNSYITCLSKSSSCFPLEQLNKISSEEIQRAKIPTCVVPLLSSAAGLIWSALLLVSALLCFVVA